MSESNKCKIEKSEEECLCGDGGCAYILFTERYINICMVCVAAVVQLLSCVLLFATPWTAAQQVSLSFSVSRSLPKFMCIELVMLSNRLLFCCPLLLLPSIFPSLRVFSSELALHTRWPKYWSFSFSISPYNESSGLVSFRID